MLVRRWLDAAGVADPVLRDCYLFCVRDVARRDDGYAKFPLRALPAAVRPYVAAAIALGYAADDRADTGPVETRRQRLDEWAEAALTALALMTGQFGGGEQLVPVFSELGELAQLVDLLCDLSADLREGRLYLPLEDLARFGVRPDELKAAHWTPATAELIAFEAVRVRRRMPVLVTELERLLPWPVAPTIGDYCELHVRDVPASRPALLQRPVRPDPTEAFRVWLPHARAAVPG